MTTALGIISITDYMSIQLSLPSTIYVFIYLSIFTIHLLSYGFRNVACKLCVLCLFIFAHVTLNIDNFSTIITISYMKINSPDFRLFS